MVLETRIWPIRVIVAEQVCNKSQDKHFPLYLQGYIILNIFTELFQAVAGMGPMAWMLKKPANLG